MFSNVTQSQIKRKLIQNNQNFVFYSLNFYFEWHISAILFVCIIHELENEWMNGTIKCLISNEMKRKNTTWINTKGKVLQKRG